MPEFLDGIQQGGGGLTTVADVTVSGGAVTELNTGAIALENDRFYKVYIVSISATTSGLGASLLVNGLTSGYSRDVLYTAGATGADGRQSQVTNSIGNMSPTVGGMSWFEMTIFCNGSTVSIQGMALGDSASASKQLWSLEVAASSISSIGVTCATTNNLDDGTRIIITEAY